MATADVRIQRPQRWDAPFDELMDDAQVEVLSQFHPFREMDPSLFPRSCSLSDLLRNDARLVSCEPGDIILREGDYGSSAFVILTGSVRVLLESLSPEVLGRSATARMGWWDTLAQVWRNSHVREERRRPDTSLSAGGTRSIRSAAAGIRVFLQDVPGVLDTTRNLRLTAGEIFGELAALSRTPRTATVVADGEAQLLEIRWQGLRDIMRYAPAWKEYVNRIYRENSLQSHLRETPWMSDLSPSEVQTIADATSFETYGEFEWHTPYRSLSDADAAERLAAEPLIDAQDNYANGVLLIRSGFARLCRSYGHGQRTCAYLGKGDSYGLAEAVYNWRNKSNLPLQFSLRAVGYVDVLRIPAPIVEEFILPRIAAKTFSELIATIESFGVAGPSAFPDSAHFGHVETGLLEFLLDHRTNNGAQTMLIDMQRCTRCDDCVRACAATHDNNPRFVRQGPRYGNVMIAHACMHCVDPVCMIGCPTGAISRDLTTGTVLLNDATCIGCGTCANSCPYHNILLAELRDSSGKLLIAENTGTPIVKATKCDLCSQQPTGPACQRACPHDALVRMDMGNLPQLQHWLNR